MLKQKNIFGILVLFLLLVNFGFILAQEIEISEEIVSFDSEKVNYIDFESSVWGDDANGFYFEEEGGFVEIKGNRFENILPAISYIIIDNKGNILQADLTANEKGSIFLINGLTFKAPPNSRVYYDKDGFWLKNVDIIDIKKDQFVNLPIIGENVNFFNELFLDSGTVFIRENGYSVRSGNFIYDNIQIRPKGFNDFLIEKNSLRDLSNYKENFIQHTENGLKIQSQLDAEGFNLRFIEGNEIFDIPPSKDDKESFLSMDISGGDGLEITKKDFIIKGMPPLIKHTSAGQTTITEEGEPVGFLEAGKTIIKNGKHIFKFENGKYLSELGNLNTKNKLSVEFNLDSDILKGKTINVDNDNGYSIYELGKGNIFTFNKALLNKPNYNFESEIGKKVYSFAEEQIGDSAFVKEGRGGCYGEEELKVKGFDCIGLGISSLKKAYPDSSLSDFPPNLKLVETLEKKGWNSYIIEPTEVVGEKITENFVKNIPPGSIIFLMHDLGDPVHAYATSEEGISYQKYLNSKQKEIVLNLGHTLIRGTDEKNFINAKPSVLEEELPLRARKINENLEKQGKDPLFTGAVREGEMVPKDDYLIVISPPKT